MSAVCPLCGGAIDDATLTQLVTQLVTQLPAQAQVAHGFDSKVLGSSNPSSKKRSEGYEQGFLEFWVLYPLHRDKKKAQVAWRNAIKHTATTTINDGATRYANDPNRVKQYTKYPERWLKGECWEDEPLPTRVHAKEPLLDRLAREALEEVNANGGRNGSSPSGQAPGELPRLASE